MVLNNKYTAFGVTILKWCIFTWLCKFCCLIKNESSPTSRFIAVGQQNPRNQNLLDDRAKAKSLRKQLAFSEHSHISKGRVRVQDASSS